MGTDNQVKTLSVGAEKRAQIWTERGRATEDPGAEWISNNKRKDGTTGQLTWPRS